MSQLPSSTPRLWLGRIVRNFRSATNGNVAIMATFMMMPMIAATGLAIDYGMAVRAQNKLEQIAQSAALTATVTARRVVNSYPADTVSLTGQQTVDALGQGEKYGLAYFEDRAALLQNVTTSNRVVTIKRNSNSFIATVSYQAQVRTMAMSLFGISVIDISGSGSNIIGVMDQPLPTPSPTVPADGSALIINEAWNSNSVVTTGGNALIPVYNNWYSGDSNGFLNPLVSKTSSVLQNAPVTGAMRIGNPTNNLGRSLSKKIYLAAGDYHLRYWYRSTVIYPAYEPIHICTMYDDDTNFAVSGSFRALDSAKSTTPTANAISAAQSARAGVYLTPVLGNPLTSLAPPALSSFTQPLGLPFNISKSSIKDTAANRIDICVYSSQWIQREIPITVNSAGYYWLSFVAEVPKSTTLLNGFYLGPVQLCIGDCPGDRRNNYHWTKFDLNTNTPGTLLFSDSFETPVQNDGDAFNLTSGSINPGADYERPINNWLVQNYLTLGMVNDGTASTITTDFRYGRKGVDRASPFDFDQYVYASLSNRALTRRLLLAPGYYRLEVAAGNQLSNYPSCTTPPGRAAIDFARQDAYYTDGAPTLAPQGYVGAHGGTAYEMAGCWMIGRIVACYLVTAPLFYDIQLAAPDVTTTYVDAAGETHSRIQTYDALSFEYLAPYDGGPFPNPGNRCTYSDNLLKQFTVSGGKSWPGLTVRNFARFSVTAGHY